MSPQAITERLAIEPSKTSALDPTSRYSSRRKHNVWVWSTREILDSTDHIVHLNRIFEVLVGKEGLLESLRTDDCTMEISCFWESDGQGGPWLDLATIDSLSKLRLEIWWDIYFVQDEPSGDA
jgi:hypothetical protein